MDGATGGFALWSQSSSGQPVDLEINSTEAASVRESDEFVQLPSQQTDWEKQMESADQKQAELFHFQWKMIREQLGTLSRELADSRQEVEALKTISVLHEARDNDFSRLIQICQSSVEKESQARHTQEEESMQIMQQLRSILEQEKADRADALQSFEHKVEQRLEGVRQQQQIQVELPGNLQSSFEAWRQEFFGHLETELSNVKVKFDELTQASTQLSDSLDVEKTEREKLFQTLNDQVTKLKLRLQGKDEVDKRHFADNNEHFKAIRQVLEKECRERGVLEKLVREAIEALHLEKTESRARHSSLSGQMQAEHQKFSDTLQVLEGRLEEHREFTTKAASDNRAAWEAELARQKHSQKHEQEEELSKLRSQTTDCLESLEILLRRDFKRQFDSLKEQSKNCDVEVKHLSEEFEAKFSRASTAASMRSASESTTPGMSLVAPSTATKVTTMAELGSASLPSLPFTMSRSPSSIRALSPNSLTGANIGCPSSIRALSPNSVTVQRSTTTPVYVATMAQEAAMAPILSPSTSRPGLHGLHGSMRSGPQPVPTVLPSSIKVSVGARAAPPSGLAISPLSSPVLSSNGDGPRSGRGPPSPLPGETRLDSMARAVAESAARGRANPCFC